MNKCSPEMATPEDFAALREVEIAWLSRELGRAIKNLAYPVGCGSTPTDYHLEAAANALFERYAKMIEMARQAGGVAQAVLHPEDRTIFVLREIARGRCDNGRPLAGETARQMARAALDNWPGRGSLIPSTDRASAPQEDGRVAQEITEWPLAGQYGAALYPKRTSVPPSVALGGAVAGTERGTP